MSENEAVEYIPGAWACRCVKCQQVLATRYRYALHLVEAHGCTEAEVADVMNYAPQSVKGVLRLARIRAKERAL